MEINYSNKKLFLIAAILTITFALIEIFYGIISGSLMIIGDGIHMSSDAISLILSLIAAVLASRAATNVRTFGFKRFEPIAAFINGITLILLPLYIICEAVKRFINPVELNPKQMIIVGIIGLVINIIVGFILSKGDQNLNMRSAALHVFADMITSLSAVIVGFTILWFDWYFLDPVGSMVTSIIIIRGGLKITKEAFNILMEGTPQGYSLEEIKQTITTFTTANAIKDIKLWCTNEANVFLMIRLQVEDEVNIHSLKEKLATQYEISSDHIFIDQMNN